MQSRDYELLQKNTNPRHIFLPFNGGTITDILQKPYFVYNSCGPLDDAKIEEQQQAFPEINTDCLFVAEIQCLEEKETLQTIPVPAIIQLIQNDWEEKGRVDIEIHRKLITSPSSEKYVQFLIMIDYLTVAKLYPKTFETIRSYKTQIKSSKTLYDSIPDVENNLKMVSLHMITFNPSSQRGNQFYEKNNSLFTPRLDNPVCITMDGGCNPQKRFIAQLTSIATHGKTALILEKKQSSGYNHFAILSESSQTPISIDGTFESKTVDTSLWEEKGYYQFLQFLQLSIDSHDDGDDAINTSSPLIIEGDSIPKDAKFQFSAFKDTDYAAVFKYSTDPNHFVKGQTDLYSNGFKTGLSISLPFNILIYQMAKFTKYKVEKEIKKIESIFNNTDTIILNKILSELQQNKKNEYTDNEIKKYQSFCNQLLGNIIPYEITDVDDNEMYVDIIQGKIDSMQAGPQELSQLKERNNDLDNIIETLSKNIKKTHYPHSIKQQYFQVVKQEAKRQLEFLHSNSELIVEKAQQNLEVFSKIKATLEAKEPLEEKEIGFMNLYKLDIDNPSLISTINDIMQSLEKKEKALNAHKNMLTDLIVYPLYQLSYQSLFQQAEEKILKKSKESDNDNNPTFGS
jgi:hypothetical protein